MKHPPIARYAVKETRICLKHYAKNLRRAAKHPEDAEAIHDLRVSIRRVTQSMRAFRGLLDPAPLRKFRERVHELMDLCAGVRNCDVALDLLQQLGITADAKVEKMRKDAAQRLLKRLKKECGRRRVEVGFNTVPADGAWESDQSIEDNLRRILPGLADEFFAAGRAAISEEASYQTLHKFRLQTKRFRYTLDLFERFYGAQMALGAKILKELQDRLGAINDCATTIDLLKRDRRAVTALSKLLGQRRITLLTYARGQFSEESLAWWKKWLSRPLLRP